MKNTILFVLVICICSILYSTIINIPADQPTIQAGINIAVDGDTVLVQPETYVENINYNGKLITVGSLFLTTQDTTYISQTIIDGNGSGCVVTFENSEDQTTVLTGFTITNGYNQYGGGIHCNGSSPIIQNVIVTGNSSNYLGGGIYCNSCSPTIEYVTITGNTTSSSGGGILCSDSSPYVKNVVISDNFGGSYGGGVYCLWYSNPTLENVTITCNDVTWYGSAIYCVSSSSPILLNSIISDNLGDCAVYVSAGSPVLTYSDFWNNSGGNFYQCSAGTGCIYADPLFVDPLNGDYHLTENSPCIDAGDPSSPLDPDGSVADMGAYYFDQAGVYPIADFTADITSGNTPLTVNFTDLSTGNPTSWEWDFQNDGTIDSYEQNPQWTYYERGSYTVALTVSDGTNEDTETKEDYISLLNSPPYIQNPLLDFSFDEDTSDSSIDLFSVFDDPDLPYGDSFSFSYSGNDSILVEILNGVVTLTPLPDWFGSENITFTAFDDNLVSISDDVLVTIINVNDPPVLIGFSPQELEFTVYQDSIVTFFVEVEDIDSELNYAWFVNTYIQTEISDTFIYQFSVLGEFEIRSEVSDEEYQIDTIWDVTVEEQVGADNLIPSVTELKSNFPNPFNPETTISFGLKSDSQVLLQIYNNKGQLIKTLVQKNISAGNHHIIWDGKDDKNNSVSSGIYLYKLNVNGKTEAVRKCLLLK